MTTRPGQAYGLLIGPSAAPAPLPVPVAHFEAEAGSPENPFYPRSREEAESLPSGAHFYDPAGVLRARY
jgi:hypothetical protein